MLQREGWKVNHKRIYRLYKEEGLQMRTKVPRRRVSFQVRERRPSESRPNECWSMDFVSDQLFDGHQIRILTIVDNFTRVSPFIGVDFRYKGVDVVRSLEEAVRQYGMPKRIQ